MVLKSKKAKIAFVAGVGVLAAVVVGGGLLVGNSGTQQAATEVTAYTYSLAKEGSIASSTLLAGTVQAAEEQYVYYDASKGDLQSILVAQGDQVTVGQNLVQYDTASAQAAYETAVRARDKIARQITDLKTNGQTVSLTGDSTTDSSSVASAQRSVNSQLQDLNDSYADAQAQVDKAAQTVGEATVKSTVAGTVVEVNKSVSKSNTSTNQTLVHIVNQGSLQVVGSLSEYDLANIAVDQEVKITSKVYPDQVWTGKISYISNYPSSDAAASVSSTSGTSSKYPFKATITSEIGSLKQGFSVNIEVVNGKTSILVPVAAVVTDAGKHYVWTIVDGQAKRVEVTLGSADATNQEISSGLTAGDQVISNPDASLKDGKEVSANEETTN